jgi:hypothetical protein
MHPTNINSIISSLTFCDHDLSWLMLLDWKYQCIKDPQREPGAKDYGNSRNNTITSKFIPLDHRIIPSCARIA